MKKLTSFFLMLLLLISLSIPAAAAEIGQVEYRAKGFSFLPGYREGQLTYPTDLFPELKNVMPGDVLHQQVKITHKGSSAVDIVVYIKAEGSDENEEFISQLRLEVTHKDEHILYTDPYDATKVSDWKRLVTLSPGKSTTLDLTLTVPKELSNEFANDRGTVVWSFKVEERPTDPNAPRTYDESHLRLWLPLMALTASSLTMLLIFRRKRK